MIENPQFSDADSRGISATENGINLSIPVFPGNRHYDEIVASEMVIAPYVVPEKEWDEIRSERDALLHDSDWMAMADRTISEAQTEYRKKLRDIPQDFANPAAVVWPTL
jgi:hypothetical protein